MSALSNSEPIAVIGAGAMGAGIAQVAAAAGHPVWLLDIAEGAAQQGKESIKAGLGSLVAKGKKTQTEVDDLLRRIQPVRELEALADSRMVIEAVVENVDVKQKVFSEIESLCADETIIASNTSSISISALAANAKRPENIVGMHFFNPAAILKLVEVVSGLKTSQEIAKTVFDTAQAWGKLAVHAKSTPGFIVNRVARPFYAEALRSLNEQLATVATIDTLMRSCGGFKMGPLELIDLIGQDVNHAVTESVYQAFYQDKRFMPSVLQADMVAAGLLGRKSGQGFYDYSNDKPEADTQAPTGAGSNVVKLVGSMGPVDSLLDLLTGAGFDIKISPDGLGRIEVGEAIIQLTDGRTASQRAADQCTPNLILFDYAMDYRASTHVALSAAAQASDQARHSAIGFFQTLGKSVCMVKDLPGMQVMRTVGMLVNEAYDAVNQGVCNALAVDRAMLAGMAYPYGPIKWGGVIGLEYLVLVIENLHASYGEGRYRVSPLLKSSVYALQANA